MTTKRLLRILLGLVFLGTLVWTYAPWPTRTIIYKDQNFQCQVPYNWYFKDNPRLTMDAHRPYGGTFGIEAKPLSALFRIDDPSFAQAIKDRLTTDGFEILGEDREPFQGHVTYSYTIRKTINGHLVYTHSLNFIAGQFRYNLIIAKKAEDPIHDQQLQAALNSFSLINPATN